MATLSAMPIFSAKAFADRGYALIAALPATLIRSARLVPIVGVR
jgi:hypothetical protein